MIPQPSQRKMTYHEIKTPFGGGFICVVIFKYSGIGEN